MSNIYRNPNNSYSHRTVEIPPNSRVLFISGQTATDENGKTPADPWDKPKGLEISKWIKPDTKQQLTIRVVKDRFAAGINGRVRLMESFKTVGDR